MFLIGDLEIANRALKILACRLQLLLKMDNARRVSCRFNRAHESLLSDEIINEADEEQSLTIALDWPGGDAYRD
jgi:hypothetical protein